MCDICYMYKQSGSLFQFIQQKNALVYNYIDAKPNIKEGNSLLARAFKRCAGKNVFLFFDLMILIRFQNKNKNKDKEFQMTVVIIRRKANQFISRMGLNQVRSHISKAINRF